jgi:hypothetical protein
MSRAFQDYEIRQYLLGDMSAAEEGELETAYFRDPELLARVDLARDAAVAPAPQRPQKPIRRLD